MTDLVIPVVLASLAGGLHCVAMCGPFAATSGGLAQGGRASLGRQVPYHLGRLATYAGFGGAAGALGHAIDAGGALGGFSRLSSILAGAAMIAFGVSSLLPRGSLIPLRRGPSPSPQRLTRALVWISRRAPVERAFLLGLATTLLPCGWLYAFVATAAGTGGVLSGIAVMVAFWAGTLPWLLGAALGISALVPRLGARVRTASAALVAISGLALIVLRTGPSLAAPTAAPKAAATAGMPADCPLHRR